MPDIAQLQVTVTAEGADRVQQTFQRLDQTATQLTSTVSRLQAQLNGLGGAGGLSGGLSNITAQLQQINAQAQQASQSTTNLTSSMSTLGTVVKALAIGYVIKEISDYLLEAAQSAARFQTMAVVLTTIGQNAGYSRAEMLSYAESVQKSGIAMVESREIVARLAQAQIDLSKSQQLARIAQDSATIAGINSTEAMTRMVHGIQTGHVEILRYLGINVSLSASYQKLATSLGKTTESLSEQEKMQARVNAVLDYGSRIAGTYEAAMGTAGKQLTSFQRYLDDFKTKMGEAFNPTTTSVVMNAAETMKKLQEVISDPKSQEALNSLATAMGNMANSIITKLPAALEILVSGLQKVMNTWEAMPSWMKVAVAGGAATMIAGPRAGYMAAGAAALGGGVSDEERELRTKLAETEINDRLASTRASAYDINKPKPLLSWPSPWSNNSMVDWDSPAAKGSSILRSDERLVIMEKLAQIQLGKIGGPQSGANPHLVKEFEDNVSTTTAGKHGYENSIAKLIDDQTVSNGAKTLSGHDKAYKERELDKLHADTKKGLEGRIYGIHEQIRMRQEDSDPDQIKKKKDIEALEAVEARTKKELTEVDAGYAAAKESLNKARLQEEKQLSTAIKLLDEMANKNKIAQMELGGDKYGAARARIIAEFEKERDDINTRLIDAKAGKEELRRAQELAAQARDTKLQKVGVDAYTDGLKDTAKHLSSLASMGQGSEWDAKRYAAWAVMEEEVTKNMANRLKVTQTVAEYEAKIVEIARQEAEEKAKLRGEYATLVGDSRTRYDSEIKVLELEKEKTQNADKLMVIEERISRAKAKRDGDTGKLFSMGMSDAANRAYDDWIDKVENSMPQAIDSTFSAVSGHLADAISGVKSWGDAWKDLQKTISQSIARILTDLAMAWAKKKLFEIFGLGGGEAASASSATSAAQQVLQRGANSTPQSVASTVSSATGVDLSGGIPSLGRTAAASLQSIAQGEGTGSVSKTMSGANADLSSVSSPRGTHLEKLNDVFASRLGSMAKEFEERTGRKLSVSDGFRTYEQQADLKRRKPGLAAEPGMSMHEYGYAVDLDSKDAEEAIAMGLGEKYGLDYLKGRKLTERWHWQPTESFQNQAGIRSGAWSLGGKSDAASVGDFGLLGRDAAKSLSGATSSYGAFGAFFGMLGAPSVINQLPKKSTTDVLTGTSTDYWNSLTVGGGSSSASLLEYAISNKGSGYSSTSDGTSDWTSLGSWSKSVTANAGYSAVMVGSDGQLYVEGSGSSLSSATGTAATTAQQQTQSGSSGFNMSDVTKMGGSSSWVDSLNNWGMETFGIGGSTGSEFGEIGAFAGKNVSGWSTGSAGLGTMASGALTGAGIGYGVSSMIYPNGTGTVGGTIGGAVGGLAGAALGGTALGSVLGPIGGIIGGVLGSVLSGHETKTTEKTGSGVTVDMTGGTISQSGYSTYRTTTSGMFGSSSTSHSKSYDTVGDPEIEAAFREKFEEYQVSTNKSLKSMFLDNSTLSSYFPIKLDIDSENADFAGKSVANYQAFLALQANGLQEEFDATAKSGEVYVDQIKRISEGYSNGTVAAAAAGASLEKLSGSISKVYQGDWYSRFAQAMGGTDEANTAFATLSEYGMSKTEAANNALSAYATGAGNSIAELKDSSVNINNFWAKYKEAVQGGNLTTDQMQNWANAASWMKNYDDTLYNSASLMQEINSTRITQLQAEMKAVENVKVMVDGVKTSVSSAYSTYNSLNNTLVSTIQGVEWNGSLSPNTPSTTYGQQKAYYDKLKAKVAGEDSSSLTYSADIQKLSAFSQTFLQTSKSYFGASKAYYEDYNDVTSTLENLQSQTQTEVDVLLQQLTVQQELSNKNQEEIDQLSLANTNLGLLAAGLDGLGTSIQAGLEALGATMSWSPNIGSAVSDAIAAQASTAASLAATAASISTNQYIPSELGGPATSTDSSGLSLTGWGLNDPYNGSGSFSGFLGGFAAGGVASGPGYFRFNENGQEFMALGEGTSAAVTSNEEFTGILNQGNAISAAGFRGLQALVAQQSAQISKLTAAVNRQNSAPSRAK